MSRLGIAMARYHAPTQLAVLVTLVVALGLTGAALLIAVATGSPQGGDPAGGREMLSELTASIMGWTIALTCIATVFLTTSTVAFSLGTRAREIALLRLAGARPGQVSAMLVMEHALLGALAGAMGGLLAWPVAQAARGLLIDAGFAPADISVPAPGWTVPAVAGIGLMLAALGALRPARKAARVDPLVAVSDAVPPRRALSWVRAAVGLGAAVGVVVLARAPMSDANTYLSQTIGLVALAVLTTAALAPLVVPSVTTVLGAPVAWVWQGPGRLAVEQTRFGAARAASLAMPILLVLGMTGGVSWAIWSANSNGRGEAFAPVADVVAYSTAGIGGMSVISGAPQTSGLDGAAVRAALTDQSGVEAWTASTIAMLPASMPGRASTTVTFAAVDLPGAIALGYATELVGKPEPIDDPAGDQKAAQPDVDGGAGPPPDPAVVSVVSADPATFPQGSRLEVNTGDGATVSLRVTATTSLTGPIWASILIPPDTAAGWGVTWVDAAYLALTPGTDPAVVRDALAAALPEATVLTGPQDAAARQRDAGRQTVQALISLLAAVVIMAAVAIVTTSLSAAHERRRETQVLVRSGASRAQVLATAALQCLLVVAVAGLAAGGVMACVYVRLRTMTGSPPTVPWLAASCGLGVATLLTLVATLVGTWRALAQASGPVRQRRPERIRG